MKWKTQRKQESRKVGEMMEYNPDTQDDLGNGGQFKNWMQDNIRIILSILIVLAIAGGIYSYSKRTDPTLEELAMLENTQLQDQGIDLDAKSDKNQDDEAVSIIGDEEAKKKDEKKDEKAQDVIPNNQTEQNKDVKTEPTKEPEKQPELVKPETVKPEPAKEQPAVPVKETQPEPAKPEPAKPEPVKETTPTPEPKPPVVIEPKKEDVKVGGETDTKENQISISQETGEGFVETAMKGDSLTTLSRKAVKDYLEKNTDSSLTAEHKIYIEDYLRRHVNQSPKIAIGGQVTFSKILIKDAIEKAKTLTPQQLNNLHQYSARVPNL